MTHGKQALETVFEYHEETKHHLDRSARSLGYMDWATQPDPFRRYEGAPRIALDHPDEADSPAYDQIFQPGAVSAQSLSKDFLSRLFYDSLALSAWKQAPGMKPWPLRTNPSSGNLHPTEAYLLCAALPEISEKPGIYHYSPFEHALEQRIDLTSSEWDSLIRGLSTSTVFVVLTSIYWRESWKYGERAFRYCNHDIGHAAGAISLAAAALGWHSRLLETVSDEELRGLLALAPQAGIETEEPDCILMLSHEPCTDQMSVSPQLLQRLSATEYHGKPNQLSQEHHAWPIIDRVSEATKYPADQAPRNEDLSSSKRLASSSSNLSISARRLFRQRRSAVAMDASTSMTSEAFFHLLERLAATRQTVPFSLLPWNPFVSLLLFIHRVEGLNGGMYLLVRNPEHLSLFQDWLRPEFLWKKAEGCPDTVPLYLLAGGDCRNAAKIISCHQNIAEDGVFSLGMLAHFEPVLREFGACYYRRLHWECGLIGQLLYLEAEAAGISGTGIGCFHDDVLHRFVGLQDRTWQTLYHFTVGKALQDSRLQTIPAYHHLWEYRNIEQQNIEP